MLRRQARQRREYLYRKSQELQAKQLLEKKQKLRQALEEGKALPTELRREAAALQKEMQLDPVAGEDNEAENGIMDDEYAKAGIRDPKIVITTSRDPSSRLQQFAKEMRLVFPNSQRVNRGNHVISEIVSACRSNEVTDLILLHETRGVPDALIVSHFPHGPTAYFTLHNVVLRHDLAVEERGTVSEQYPHLIFDGMTSKLGERCRNILKYLFPVPKEESKRVMTFANKGDFISFRHHVFYPLGNTVTLSEVGPRFEMRLYEIRLGTIDMDEADKEWVLRPYMRTGKKRDVL